MSQVDTSLNILFALALPVNILLSAVPPGKGRLKMLSSLPKLLHKTITSFQNNDSGRQFNWAGDPEADGADESGADLEWQRMGHSSPWKCKLGRFSIKYTLISQLSEAQIELFKYWGYLPKRIIPDLDQPADYSYLHMRSQLVLSFK